MLRSKKLIISASCLLIVVAAGFLLVNECAYGGGMAASYKDCDCLGYEWGSYTIKLLRMDREKQFA